MDINTNHNCSRTMDLDMVLSCSQGSDVAMGVRSMWLQARLSDPYLASSDGPDSIVPLSPQKSCLFSPAWILAIRPFINQSGALGKKLQGQCFRIVSVESPVKLYCCYGVITVLTVAVFALSVALSVRRSEQTPDKYTYAFCPRNWIGFGSKCFYFSENTNDWTFSQNFCKEQEAHLAQFDSDEELEFLKRYKGAFDYWIGLRRESPEHPWMWTDNTQYNSSYVFIPLFLLTYLVVSLAFNG
ncbi:C-type lectin domain family 2 member i [Cricetulus griseus]